MTNAHWEKSQEAVEVTLKSFGREHRTRKRRKSDGQSAAIPLLSFTNPTYLNEIFGLLVCLRSYTVGAEAGGSMKFLVVLQRLCYMWAMF